MAAQLDPRSIGSVVQSNPIALDPATSQTQQHFNFRHEALKSSKKKLKSSKKKQTNSIGFDNQA